ncbi:MAG: ATPase, partial [Oscillospiraceae bacterium]|nr:ATPase [Oscillospiraceae bacterium]
MNLSNTALGIELGSTRIKAVLIDENHVPVASGSFEWENQYDGGIWTYPMSLVQEGLQACFADLAMSVRKKFGVPLTTVGALGVSAMMHGYLPFDQDDRQL